MAGSRWAHVIGLGVAGDFAGHLEHAGEVAPDGGSLLYQEVI